MDMYGNPTHHAGGGWSDDMKLVLEPKIALYYFFIHASVAPKTCKDTLMFTISQVTL